MYQDIPNEALSFGLMNNIFHNYPYIYDVGGTIEDVYKIDKNILYYCYDLFYHPQNMNLVVVGNVDPDRMFDFIEENQKKKVFKEYLYPQLVIDEESDDVVRNYVCKEMDITNSKVIIGFKLPMRKSNITRNQLIIEDIYYRIIRNILFGNHTNFSQKLLDDKVILGPLSSGYNGDNYTQYFSVLGETNDPDAFIKRVKKRMNDLKHLSFSNREVSRIKKDLIGKFIISLNSIDAIMGDYLESLARDYNFFDFIDIVNQINIETLRKISKTLLNLPNSVFVIKPNKK